jgi:spore germination protein
VGRCLRLLFATAAALAWLSQPGPWPVAAAGASGHERWAFYVGYDPESRSSLVNHLSQIDVVVPNYFGIQGDGTIVGDDDPDLDALVATGGKRLLPLVQNRVRYGDFSSVLSNRDIRGQVVDRLVALANRERYDGITLDLEAILPSDRQDLTSFVQALGAALHQQNKMLAVAVPATSGDMTTGWAGAFDYAAVGAVADRVILMAYGYRTASSTQPGPIAPLPWMRQVSEYAHSRIPADRLLLGIGVWGYDWNLTRPGRASTLRYSQTAQLVDRTGGSLNVDPTNASVSYRYRVDGQDHQIWFENVATIRQKIALADEQGDAGIAIWRLGQEPPDLWDALGSGTKADYAIPGGWFFSETGGGGGLGYRVTDDSGARFWTEFRRLGGVATLGYPCSQRYVGKDGFTYQAFQRGILQWRPDRGVAVLANTFEQLTDIGWDARLDSMGIPPPVKDDGSGGDWIRARQIRLGWLTNPAIAAAFYANPSPAAIVSWDAGRSIQLFGLPSSLPRKSGPFIVQRFQRISLQLWVEDVPGMPPKGSVVGILGGDIAKQAGLIPPEAASPELP